MPFNNTPNFRHDQTDKIGVLITNLGTPAAPTGAALKPYLKQFLSDPRVVEVPRLIWWLVLNLVILNFRPKRSAGAYQKVWQSEGSPLLIHTKNQTKQLQQRAAAAGEENLIIDYAMRYGAPSVAEQVSKLMAQGVRQLLVLPLYPQYSATTTASTFDALAQDFTQRRLIPELRFINHYHDHPAYIQTLANKVRNHWQQKGKAQKLLMSYHGIPERYLHNGDPYFCECHKTSRLLAEALELNKDDYLVVFQSRFGREPWLQPYCDETLKALPKQGVTSVDVICPGFSADCLETIEEIDEENRDYFIAAGGERFEYIPALNDDDEHIDMLYSLIQQNLQGWSVAPDPERSKRAQDIGAKQ